MQLVINNRPLGDLRSEGERQMMCAAAKLEIINDNLIREIAEIGRFALQLEMLTRALANPCPTLTVITDGAPRLERTPVLVVRPE